MTLSDFISTHIESILVEWDAFAQSIFSTRKADLTMARDHAKGILFAIAADIDHAQTPLEQAEKSKGHGPLDRAKSEATMHGVSRMVSGFNLMEEVSEFRALRASVLRLWSNENPVATPCASEELIRFNEAIDQALAESIEGYSAEKDRYALLLDKLLSSSPDLNYILDLNGSVIYANKALTLLFRMSPDEIIGKRFSELSAATAEIPQHVALAVASKETFRGDLQYTNGAGKNVSYEYLLVPVLNAQGQVESIAGSARDITVRKQLEDDIARERAISDTIIESAPGAFFMIDQQFHLVRWNKYLQQETGLSDAQLPDSSILASIHEEDRALAAAKFMAAFATGYTHMEVRMITPNRGTRYFLKSARRFMVDKVPYLAGFCFDVTDRKQSEEALEKEKIFSDALIESMPGAFYVLDMEGNFFRWNNYLNRLTGLSDRALRQRPLLLSVHEDDRPLAAATMKDAFDTGYAQAELHILTKDRGVRLFFMTARRFRVGLETYLVGVGTDTTEWLVKMKNLEHLAWTDPLTKIANRGHFMELARQEFARCRRYGHPVSLWMIDIDHFKSVNDTYGHHAGDIALQSLVSTSQQTLRDWDILGRVGGEEFAVLLPETGAERAMLVAERLRQAVAASRILVGDGVAVALTVSIGIATVKEDDADLETLLDRADQSLYEAKRTGRDKVCQSKQVLLA
ncbi:MAG: diguanylate cyclase [Rhodoferax sp.]|nr:diguanylate cyclase [Rhodoferax sp.]MDP3652948.1 diguanylate cyclase [Rhodoferax sp.]